MRSGTASLALVVAVALMGCASAPPSGEPTGGASLLVSNPLEVPVRVYQLYQNRPVFDPRLAMASCVPLGEVPARDSVVFNIVAGTTSPIGVVFQADSLNGITADVSRSMQAQAGGRLHFSITRLNKGITSWGSSRSLPTRAPIASRAGDGPGSRTTERC